MNREELKSLVIEAIRQVAPEIEEGDVDPAEDLREQCDLDSMDFLNFLAALKKSCGVTIPEADYSRVNTLEKMLVYLADKVE